jgi:hypothetical protein
LEEQGIPTEEGPPGPRRSNRVAAEAKRKLTTHPATSSKTRNLKDTATERGRIEAKSSTKTRTEAYQTRSALASTSKGLETSQEEIPSQSQPTPVTSLSRGQPQAQSQNQTQTQQMSIQKLASFRVPRSWEANAPKFISENPNELLDFIDQVGEIIELSETKVDAEKKKLLTGYLPVRKKNMWRDMDSYANDSYEDFLKEVYKSYPEIKQEKEGTLGDLERLCRSHQGIRLQDEGKLRRFGVEFASLFKKLSKQPAIILNKEACWKYLDTLDSSFAIVLKSSISSRNLLKADLNRAAGVQPPAVGANAVDHRKEDPILLKDLIEMAEQLATMGVAGTTWEGYDVPDKKRSSMLPVKIERKDEKLDELSEEVAGIKDFIQVIQKEAKLLQAELMKAFQMHVKESPAPKELNVNRELASGHDASHRPIQDRFQIRGNFNRGSTCFYCDGQDHFARECPAKAGHMNKGWVAVEDGVQRLGDGNPLPKGRGPLSSRVEEYYARRPASQNLYSTEDVFYGNEAPDGREMDAMWDEMRTLRVKLNQVTKVGQETHPVYMASAPVQQNYVAPRTQSTDIAQAPVQPQVANNVPEDQVLSTNFVRAMMNFLNTNAGGSEQLLVTRGGKDSAPQPGQGF